MFLLCAIGVFGGSASLSTSVLAEQPSLPGDLESMHPEKLSKEQLEQLLPGAKMSRKAYTGSTNYWTNEPGGTLLISTDNRGRIGTSSIAVPSTAPGKWYISPDGRYCGTIKWNKIPRSVPLNPLEIRATDIPGRTDLPMELPMEFAVP